MQILSLIFYVFMASASLAEELIISNIKIRSALQTNYSIISQHLNARDTDKFKKQFLNSDRYTIYLDIENSSDTLDYLTAVKIIDSPDAIITLNKTVIEKNIARIIHIDQLAIPSHTKISLAPGGIYIVAKNLPSTRSVVFQFHFKHHGIVNREIIYLE